MLNPDGKEIKKTAKMWISPNKRDRQDIPLKSAQKGTKALKEHVKNMSKAGKHI